MCIWYQLEYGIVFSSAPLEVTELDVDVISDSNILVQWDPPARANGILIYYTIVVFNNLTGYIFSSQVDSMDEEEASISGLSMSCIQ